MKKFVAFIKGIVLKNGGKISITKVLALITAGCASLIELPHLFTVVNITIPAFLVSWIKGATIVSGLLTLYRAKWDIEKAKMNNSSEVKL
jgi:hypothetical protein